MPANTHPFTQFPSSAMISRVLTEPANRRANRSVIVGGGAAIVLAVASGAATVVAVGVSVA